MNIHFLKRQLTKRRESRHYDFQPIGSMLKIRRKELKLTLEEGAEGICSVSYLSKLENNLIEPNILFVDQIMKRLGIVQTIDFNQDKYLKDLYQITKDMISLHKTCEVSMDEYYHRDDHQAHLMLMLEAYILNNNKEVLNHYQKCLTFIPQFQDQEIILCLLALSETLYRMHHFKDAYDIVLILTKMHITKSDYLMLVKRLKLMICFSMHKHIDIEHDYQSYLSMVVDHSYYHLANEIKKLHLVYRAFHQPIPHIIKLSQTEDPHQELEYLPYAISLWVHQEFHKVIEIAHKRKELSGWVFIYLTSLDHMGDREAIIHLIERLENETINDSEKVILHYMRRKYLSDEYKPNITNLKEFFHEHACDDIHILEYITQDTSKQFAEFQFYKDAYKILADHYLNLKLLKRSYDIQEEGEI